MNKNQKQVIAEKIASTVRVLELLGFDYRVTPPVRPKAKGNKSPRVVRIDLGSGKEIRVYNGVGGATWAHEPNGRPIPGVKSIEDLYEYLRDKYRRGSA